MSKWLYTIVFINTILRNVDPCVANESEFRLPRHVKPLQYFLELEPNFSNDTFNGSLIIEFIVTEASNNVTLHIDGLEINPSTIHLNKSDGFFVNSVNGTNNQTDKHFFIIHFNEALSKEITYNLTIGEFKGVLNSDRQGFYLAKYLDENGIERKLATTQFAAIGARKAFPCFDEPAFKANFTVSIIRPENYTAISNQPAAVLNQTVSDGRFRDIFQTTPKMPTYILAFIISGFNATKQLGIHKVYARPEEIKAGNAQYALEAANQTLKVIEEFVNVSYVLGKLDMVAIPDDYFYYSAMENWGLVTYKESVLLHSNKMLTSQRQKIGTTIAHEFGHQWFGNLVTMEWWTHVWLSEGFATYFQYYASSLIEPTWDMMGQFIIKNLQYAFADDALESTRPMNEAPKNNSVIIDYYDVVAYQKAASVIRMTETFLTTPIFRKGLNKYLTKWQYNNTVASDLYDAWQEALNESAKNDLLPKDHSVSAVLSSWDSAAGYPVIDVKRNYTSNSVTFSQSRFLLNSSTTAESTHVWIVPITFATQTNYNFTNTSTDVWLTTKNASITISNINVSEWLIINKQERGYYRVNYDESNWWNLISYLSSDNYTQINKLNRAQLVDDAFNLARSGRLSYNITLKLAEYLKREADYFPLYSFFTALSFLDTELTGSEPYGCFKQYVISLLEGSFQKLGPGLLNEDTHLEVLNRIDVLKWLCRYGHGYCRGNATALLNSWKNNSTQAIHPDLQEPYFCGAIAGADEELWDFLYSQYEASNDTAYKGRIINGLGCSENATILKKYLDKVSSSTLKSSDKAAIFASVYNAGEIGVNYAFDYFKEHLQYLDNATTSTVLKGISMKLTTKEQLHELESVLNNTQIDKSVLANIQENIEWLGLHLEEITSYLSNYNCISSTTDSPGTTTISSASTPSCISLLHTTWGLLFIFINLLPNNGIVPA